MTLRLGHLVIYRPSPPDSLRQFVQFWAAYYDYRNESVYTKNIAGPHTRDGLLELFRWKIGKRFFDSKVSFPDECFISRLDEASRLLRRLRKQELCVIAKAFLERFEKGGAIWRIFWLHCLDTRFPIYDQHVHRAMAFMQEEQREELPIKHQRKVELYLNRYLPFFQEHFTDMDGRKVDQALWTFGKALKKSGPPPLP